MSDPEFYYPPLDLNTLKQLEVVRQLMLDHPAYFSQSPYGGEVEQLLRKWFSNRVENIKPEERELGSDDKDSWQVMHDEAVILFNRMKNMNFHNLEASEKNSYLRTSTALLEKLITLQERALNLKNISDFYNTVLEIMESQLSGDQRTKIMEQLKSMANKK